MRLAPFNGDYEAVANLIEQSWAENKESSLRYTPEFIRSCFEYPGTTVDLAPTIYEGDRPVAFIAGFPRNVEWNEQRERLILSTLLTSSPETKGKGYGAWLWMDLARKAREAGYDGMISICVAGGHVNRIVEAGGARLGYATARIFTIGYQSIVLTSAAKEIRECSDADIDLFLELAETCNRQIALRRIWTRPEVEWQCRARTGAVVTASHTPEERGIVTGYVVDMVASPPVRVLVIEDLLWNEMQPDARTRLLNEFLAQGAARGAQYASVAITGYTAYESLRTVRFQPIRRRMNVYVTRWSGRPPEPVDALYLDVL
jgi:GNAT superfamily N-acetyltransferase